jgi:O-antigen biosynthesis protein WbqP
VSGVAIVVLAIPMLIVAIVIKIDDPGPVLFKQKRIGQNKNGEVTYFMIWKFRSMKMSTPHDTPTHLLENPEQYITRVGKFIRKTSIDELPQIYQVMAGRLSCIGPRPGLWNQTTLWEEREKYGANDVKPGITGWAQINGRDELEIPVKAALDGEYVQKMGLFFDIKCFFGTFISVLKHDGVVEGGTGTLNEQKKAEEEAKAVELPLQDMQKREAIQKATGFNVTAAIQFNAPDPDEEEVKTEEKPARRVVKAEAPARRVERPTESKYTIIE